MMAVRFGTVTSGTSFGTLRFGAVSSNKCFMALRYDAVPPELCFMALLVGIRNSFEGTEVDG